MSANMGEGLRNIPKLKGKQQTTCKQNPIFTKTRLYKYTIHKAFPEGHSRKLLENIFGK